jgi:hypothetical protein
MRGGEARAEFDGSVPAVSGGTESGRRSGSPPKTRKCASNR